METGSGFGELTFYHWLAMGTAVALIGLGLIARAVVMYYRRNALRLNARAVLRYRASRPEALRHVRINLRNRSDFPVIVEGLQFGKPGADPDAVPVQPAGDEDFVRKLDARVGRSSIRLEPDFFEAHAEEIRSGKSLSLATHVGKVKHVHFEKQDWDRIRELAGEA